MPSCSARVWPGYLQAEKETVGGHLEILVFDLQGCTRPAKLLRGDACVCITQSEVRWDHPLQLLTMSKAKSRPMMNSQQKSWASLSIDSSLLPFFFFFFKAHRVVSCLLFQSFCFFLSLGLVNYSDSPDDSPGNWYLWDTSVSEKSLLDFFPRDFHRQVVIRICCQIA